MDGFGQVKPIFLIFTTPAQINLVGIGLVWKDPRRNES